MVLQWIYSGGTVALNGDYRTCSWTPSVSNTETTAGSDTHQTFLPTVKNATASIGMVAQTGGTAMIAALAAGNSGTLIIGPEGTASGKPKITFPSFSNGAQFTYPYAGTVEFTCSFTETAAYTEGSY
jgi:hypothetical protein